MTLKAEDCYLGKFYANKLLFADGHKVEENWSKLKATNATLSWSILDTVFLVICELQHRMVKKWTNKQNKQKQIVFYAILKQVWHSNHWAIPAT